MNPKWETGPPLRSAAQQLDGVHHLPFGGFEPHRLTEPLDTRRLGRLGIVAIGRAMGTVVCVAEIGIC